MKMFSKKGYELESKFLAIAILVFIVVVFLLYFLFKMLFAAFFSTEIDQATLESQKQLVLALKNIDKADASIKPECRIDSIYLGKHKGIVIFDPKDKRAQDPLHPTPLEILMPDSCTLGMFCICSCAFSDGKFKCDNYKDSCISINLDNIDQIKSSYLSTKFSFSNVYEGLALTAWHFSGENGFNTLYMKRTNKELKITAIYDDDEDAYRRLSSMWNLKEPCQALS